MQWNMTNISNSKDSNYFGMFHSTIVLKTVYIIWKTQLLNIGASFLKWFFFIIIHYNQTSLMKPVHFSVVITTFYLETFNQNLPPGPQALQRYKCRYATMMDRTCNSVDRKLCELVDFADGKFSPWFIILPSFVAIVTV